MIPKSDGHGPLYQQVYDGLRQAILGGGLRAGQRLPSTRALAAQAGLSRNTVLQAFDQLLAEGYVEARLGSGTYVAAELPDAPFPVQDGGTAGRGRRARAGTLSGYGTWLMKQPNWAAGSGNTPLPRYDFQYGTPPADGFPHDIWRRLLARHSRRASPRRFCYGPSEGVPALREAIAEYLGRARGVRCTPGQVLVLTGSQQALDLTARVLLDARDGVVIEDPHYSGARHVFRSVGARLIPVPVDEEGLDVGRLPAGRRAARLVCVTPSHQFPTGAVLPLSRRLELLAWARRTRAYVLEDDYDSEFRYRGRPVEALQGLDQEGRVLYAGTFSKILFPSLRIGYLVLPDALTEVFRRAKWLADRGTSTLEQEVLADFIAQGHFERHLRRCRTRYAARREALMDALAKHCGGRISIVGTDAGIHLLVWLRDIPSAGADAFIERARERGLGLYSVRPYYVRPPRRAGLLLGYASLTEGEIREGVRRLAEVLRDGPAVALASAEFTRHRKSRQPA